MKPETQSFYEAAVQRAAERVASDLDSALDLSALARTAALSPLHFHRVFRGMLGETPLELHRRLRLERAASALRSSDAPVTEIAFTAGYETHESFTRAFREHYACSPTDFRRSHREHDPSCGRPPQSELAARSGIHFDAARAAVTPIVLNRRGGDMDVTIKEMPELRVATVSHRGPYNRISEAFARLGQLAAGARLFGPESAMIAIYHDDPETTPESELRSDAALVVSRDAKLPAGLGELRLPSGRYACTTHVGPYEELGDAWARLMGEWLPKSGARVTDGVSYEIYRNTPADVPKSELRTELYVPLKE
ncbi:MAG TPA: AraC family transcriptional regulator [Polyangiaceae bacterium]|nr:AraC family transcriptional regulator [Polyangiaceae bacterium]